MKRILITGKNSYIGTSFENYLSKFPNEYYVETLDMRDENWKSFDFSKFDVVFHVAGIAHVSSNPKLRDLYYKVNRDLTIDVANKAKVDGVSQFIFMSSIIVYGDCKETNGRIISTTIPKPKDFYGDSKLQAEEGIKKLDASKFKVVILRPPMIYGKGSKGNFPKLSKLAKKIPIFPNIKNLRSMLYIENLCIYLKYIVDFNISGTYFPQNSEHVRIFDLVSKIGILSGNKIKEVNIFNPLIKKIINWNMISKVFGNLFYDLSLSETILKDVKLISFDESIKLTESVNE